MPSTGAGSRRPDIQGLRALAVILVVAFHADLPLPGGFIGVDVFLVISGYVITGMLLRELDARGTISLKHFYARRIKRLLPAMAVLTTFVLTASILLGSPSGSQQRTAETGLGATYFVANVVILGQKSGYFAPRSITNPLLHTWTLSVEEQVYMVFPAILLFGGSVIGLRLLRGGRRRGIAATLAALGAASFVSNVIFSYGMVSFFGGATHVAFYSPVTRIWEFAVGAGIALLPSAGLRWVTPRLSVVLGIGGASAIIAAAAAYSAATPFPGFAALVPVLGTAAIILSGTRPASPVTRLLSTSPMVRVGDLSYSWYLWHWPLIVFAAVIWPLSRVALIAAALGSAVPAWMSLRYIENPIRKNEAIRGRRVAKLFALCLVVPTIAGLVLLIGAQSSWGRPAIATMREQVVMDHVGETRGCNGFVPFDAASCQWNVDAPGRPVYLIGDSVGTSYSEALVGAARQIGSPVSVRTHDGCRLVGFAQDMTSDRPCEVGGTLEWLSEQPPGMVVVAALWGAGTTDEQIEELTQILSDLHAAGHETVILMPGPTFYDERDIPWSPDECPNVVAFMDANRCGVESSSEHVDRSLATAVRQLEQVAAATGATLVDVRSELCPDGVCRTNLDSRWLFRDGAHITVGTSESLAPYFAEVLAGVAEGFEDPEPATSPAASDDS